MYPSPVSRALCLAGIFAGGSRTEHLPTVSSEANSSRVSFEAIIRIWPGFEIIDAQFCSIRTIVRSGTGGLMMVDQEKIAPPNPLPVLSSEPSDVLALERTIESLKQENAWLRERLAQYSISDS
jgi:hypothetical protein